MRRLLAILAAPVPLDGWFLTLLALLGFVGGALHAISKRRPGVRWWEFLIAGVISAFSAIVAGSLCLWAVPNQYLAFGVSGLAGWLGTALLNVLGDQALRRIERTTLEKYVGRCREQDVDADDFPRQ